MNYKVIDEFTERKKFIEMLMKQEDIDIVNENDLIVIHFTLFNLEDNDLTFDKYHSLNLSYCWIFNKKFRSFILDIDCQVFQDWKEITEAFNYYNEILIKENIL